MTRHIRWQILLILLGVILVGILLTYLALNYTTVLRPGRGGTYIEGIAGYPSQLNPLLVQPNSAGHDVCALLFDNLTRLDANGDVLPDLATWDRPSPDGRTYTFHLRRDAYWHDGTPVTADDVIFTINLLKDPNFTGPPELGANVWQMVTAEKITRYTVKFTLTEPYAPFLDYTTIGILPAHVLEGISASTLSNAPFNRQPIGNGPFQLEDIQVEGDKITSIGLKPFPSYAGPQPYLGRVQFRFYPSHQTVLNAYEEGEVDGIAQITLADLPRARTFPDLNLFSTPTTEYGIIFFNLSRSDLPFRDKEVRQALLHGADRQTIIDQVLQGQGLVIHSPILPDTWAYNEEIRSYEYSPQEARHLLGDAGWSLLSSESTTRRKYGDILGFTLLTSSEPERVAIAEMLAEQWTEIGAQVTVETASPAEVHEALEARDFEAIYIHVAVPGDPDPYPFWHQEQIDNGQNYAGFNNRQASEAIEQARIINDQETRRRLYVTFQDIFAEEVPALLLYIPIHTYGVDARIHDVQIGPIVYPADRFDTIPHWWLVPRRVFVSESEAKGP